MNTSNGYFSDLVEAIGSGWNRFWFTPADPLPCGVLRIVVGLLAIAHLVSLSHDLDRWYSKDALLSPAAVTRLLAESGQTQDFHYSYLGKFAAGDIAYVHWAAIAAAAAFTLGLITPVSGVLTAVALLAYIHRVPQVTGHLEPVLVFLVLYLVIGHGGARLSLDRLLFGRKPQPGVSSSVTPWEGLAANIGLRLIQVHVAMFFLMMALTKLYGDAWWDGNAIWYLLAQTQSRPINLSSLRGWGRSGALLINSWTLAVVYYELAFPILIWNRLARPLLLVLGLAIWTSLILATGHLLFGLAMLTATAAFLPASLFQSLFSPRAARISPARLV
jgi:hypothetical protein